MSETLERSSGLFDAESLGFQTALITSGILLGVGFLLGSLWESIRRARDRAKVNALGKYTVLWL